MKEKWTARRNGIGKRTAGGYTYVHRSSVPGLPGEIRKLIENIIALAPAEFLDFAIVKFHENSQTVDLIKCPDFDVASEPTVGDRIVFALNKEPEIRPVKGPELVFHHKWEMVPEDYQVFSVAEEMRWSELWKNSSIPEAHDLNRIGRKDFWERYVLSKLPGRGIRFTNDEIKIANDTYRDRGAIGPNALVPRYVRDTSETIEDILDYGAGKKISHALMLRGNGFTVTAHDFGKNIDPALHDPNALSKTYDTVFLSNVINVQASETMARRTLFQVRCLVKPGGRVVLNYPATPRKAGMTTGKVVEILNEEFSMIPFRVGGTNSAPVFEVKIA